MKEIRVKNSTAIIIALIPLFGIIGVVIWLYTKMEMSRMMTGLLAIGMFLLYFIVLGIFLVRQEKAFALVANQNGIRIYYTEFIPWNDVVEISGKRFMVRIREQQTEKVELHLRFSNGEKKILNAKLFDENLETLVEKLNAMREYYK